MTKTAYISVRIEPELKAEVHEILNELGISPADAIALLYQEIKRTRNLDMDLKRLLK